MQYLNDASIVKCGVVIILTIIAIPIFTFTKLLVDSYLLGLLLYLFLIGYLLRYLGRFVMYPGSTLYVKCQLENRLSNQILKTCSQIINHLAYLVQKIIKKQAFITDHQLGFYLEKHLKGIIDILSTYQSTLTERKFYLLKLYRILYRELSMKFNQNQNQQEFNYFKIANNPLKINSLQQDKHQFLLLRSQQIRIITKDIVSILISYAPPTKSKFKISQFKYFFIQQKFYQIRFGFTNWKFFYQYQHHMVQTKDKNIIQTVIIHQDKINQQKDLPENRPAIIFCNPNGVFVQFFGLDNMYIREYLKMGYRVIMWNYRGYGSSTGTPSIKQSQKDAKTVYDYYRNLKYMITVTHGYSIGGCAAIGLAQSQPQIKVLIADRTFSKISDMSLEFGQLAQRFTKILFYFDNIQLSKQYQRCQTSYKLIICDQIDEVISQKCSLKRGILQNLSQNGFNQSKEKLQKLPLTTFSNDIDKFEDQQNQLRSTDNVKTYQQCQKDQTYQNFDIRIHNGFIQKFIQTILRIFRDVWGKQIDKGTGVAIGLSDMEVQFDSTDNHHHSKQSLAQNIVQIFKDIDGAGIILFDKKVLENLLGHQSQINFRQTCRSYLLGLIYYGSCHPLDVETYSQNIIKTNTINKISKSLQKLQKLIKPIKYSQTLENNLHIKSINIQHLRQIFIEIINKQSKINNKQFHKNIGLVLPTNNGHNCQLLSRQYQLLMKIVEKGNLINIQNY